MNRRKSFVIVISSLAFGTGIHPAVGELITFEFAGEVMYVQDDNGILPEDVGIGSPFSGSYTFESTTTPNARESGFYVDAITDVSGEVGGVPFLGPIGSNNSILVLNDFSMGGFDAYEAGCGVDFLWQTMKFSVGFRDSSGTVFSDTSLPLSPPQLESVDRVGFLLSASSEDFRLSGDVTLLVPEPTTLVMLGVGALLCARRGRTE